jgi:peptidoglycan/LPS O-acetylase OafA/YrhL
MEEFFKSLKEDFERARALWILNNLDLIRGYLSYPLYIVHYPIMYIFYAWLIKNDIYTLGDCWPMALLVIASSVALAYMCLKFYDEPVRRWLSKDKTLK